MAKRIFVSFAVEDRFARDNLVFQARQQRTPFDFVDMSVKKPWDAQWKTQCRTRIKGCDGLIAMVSDNTLAADGARWETKCAYEERVPSCRCTSTILACGSCHPNSQAVASTTGPGRS